MTDEQIRALGPAFAGELRRYRDCFGQDRTAAHFDTYCRGLLSDLPRKTVEPIALAAGTAVRTLQEFLVTAKWEHTAARDRLQRRMADALAELPPDPLGVVGVIDETSAGKKGEQTPGVQRQYLGCVGKIDNGVVTVHVGVAKGTFQALLDADLSLPQSWAMDRERCRAAGIPDEVGYRSKWRIALDQLMRLDANGVRFDWLTFDEGYGSKGPFLWVLGLVKQKFVAEVPCSFSVRATRDGPSRRADQSQPGVRTGRWRRFRIGRKTRADPVWRARRTRVWAARGWHTLVTAVNEATGEVKFFVTNAVGESLATILAVAFRRATVEHAFRIAKTEGGLTHFEGRQYVGLMRHLTLTLIVLGFVAVHTERLRGEKPAGDAGAGVPGVERGVPAGVPPAAGRARPAAHRPGDPLPPAAERAGDAVPQETAAEMRHLKPRCSASVYSYAGGSAAFHNFDGTVDSPPDLLAVNWDLTNANNRAQSQNLMDNGVWIEGYGDGKAGQKNTMMGYEHTPAPGKGVKAEVEYVFFALNNGKRQPTPKERKAEDASGTFKLIHCEWSILDEPSTTYNCHAWAGGVSTEWIAPLGDVQFVGERTVTLPDGRSVLVKEWLPLVTRESLLAFYAASTPSLEEKRDLTEANCSVVMYESRYATARYYTPTILERRPTKYEDFDRKPVPPYDTGVNSISHSAKSTSAKTADEQIVIFESKLGSSYRIEHIAEQLRGTLYGTPKYYLGKK